MNRNILASRKLLLAFTAGLAAACYVARKRYDFTGKTVVITGGSRGLGLIIARRLAGEGANLVLLARNPEQLRNAELELSGRGARVLALRCDIRKRDQVEHSIGRAVERFGRIDVLINNAGVIQVGPVAHMTCEDFEDAMAVHFFGPLFTILASIPFMRQAGQGRIVNISSIGGKIAAPHLVPYSASKFALAGLSDGLRAELRRDGISVTTVIPGLMRTGSPPNAHFKGQHHREYAWFAVSDSLPLLSMSADRAGRKIVEACRRGAPRLSLGVQTKAAILVNDLFPGFTARISALANYLLPSPDPGGSKQLFTGWDSQSSLAPSWLTSLSDQATVRNNEEPCS